MASGGAHSAFLDEHPDHVGVKQPTASPPFDALLRKQPRESHSRRLVDMQPRLPVRRPPPAWRILRGLPGSHAEDLELGFRALHPGGPIGFRRGQVSHALPGLCEY
jgi:hypothetical protein